MGVVKLKDENSFNIYHQTFLIDDDTDLNTLEQTYNCSFGDEARTPDGTVYIRHSDDFTGDKWVVKSVGNSNSNNNNNNNNNSLPTITNADIGKCLSVRYKSAIIGENIVPEQTINKQNMVYGDGYYELSNVKKNLLAIGQYIQLNIGEESFIELLVGYDTDPPYCNFTGSNGWISFFHFDYEDKYYIQYTPFNDEEEPPETLIVSINKVNYTVDWSKDYCCDLAIELNSDVPENVTEATIISGSFESATEKLITGKPLSIIVNAKCKLLTVGPVYFDDAICIPLIWSAYSYDSYYVASSSGGQTTTKIKIPTLEVKEIYVRSNGTIDGWWE